MVTILVSTKPQLPPSLHQKIFSLIERESRLLIEEKNGDVCCIIETSLFEIPEGSVHTTRAKLLQKYRASVVEKLVPLKHRTEEDFLIFIDADIISCTPRMLVELVETCWISSSCSVVAPLVFLEPPNRQVASSRKRWYDTAGFIHNGKRTELFPPYFTQDVFSQAGIAADALPLSKDTFYQPTLELNGSVGCVYCVNASLFASFDNYPVGFEGDFDPLFTEHYPLCQNAKARGGKILVRADLVAIHAYLPKYGERFH